MNIFKSFTFWVLLLSGLFMFAQWIPYTGVILMMFQAHVFAGLIPHFVAIALLLDLLIKRVPKVLLVIPILPYCVYFYYYFAEQETIKNIEASIRDANPSHIIAYNPDTHALLPSGIGISYKIPVIFSVNNNFPEGYMSQRVATQELCQEARDNKEWRRAWPVNWYRYGRGGVTKRFKNVCRFEMPETPTKHLLKVVTKEDKSKGEKLRKKVYSFFLDDKPLGEYTAATYAALPSFPNFVIGCFLNSAAPSWDCFFNIVRKKHVLNVFPSDSGFDAQDNSVVAELLGIEKYTEQELRKFTDYPETKEILSAIIEKKENETPADFDVWGLRKDSLYQPTIGEKEGFPSIKWTVYSRNKAGPFYDFIKKHEGGIVYLDIEHKDTRTRKKSIGVHAVCKLNEPCNSRTDKSFQFKNQDGSPHFAEGNKFKGFFLVGPETLFETKYNKGDDDTITVLTHISDEGGSIPKTNFDANNVE